jgi:hypothetical protein
MDVEIHLPQLEQLLKETAKNSSLLTLLVDKIDVLTLAAAASGPVSQPEPAAAAARAKRRSPKSPPAPAAEPNDKDHVEDEDALRARCEFEAKRTTRLVGLNGTRAAIARVADGVLRIDDVPAARLPALLSALQAL